MRDRTPARSLTSSLALAVVLAVSDADAQTREPRSVAPPVEIVMTMVDGRPACAPRLMRLPARRPVLLRVANRSAVALWFAAPEFLKASRLGTTRPRATDAGSGAFLVRARRTNRVSLVTPRSGRYYYACSRPAGQPRVESTGFIDVVPPPRR